MGLVCKMDKYLRRAIVPPIFIFQMGKVGSSSLRSTLKGNYPGVVAHSHRYTTMSVKLKIMLQLRKRLRLPIYVVCPVREPISRNISAFFQNFDRKHGYKLTEKEWAPGELLDFFLKHYHHNVCLEWFDRHMKSTFGLDIYAKPFPVEQKWAIYKNGSVRILIYRSDLDPALQLNVISRFIGRQFHDWIYDNISSEKDYGEMYKNFISTEKLPDSYIAKMCNSKFCRKFWSAEEINAIKKRFKMPVSS